MGRGFLLPLTENLQPLRVETGGKLSARRGEQGGVWVEFSLRDWSNQRIAFLLKVGGRLPPEPVLLISTGAGLPPSAC